MESGLLTLYSDVKSEPINWLWYPYIAIGKITFLQGDPGDGKSTMMMNLIAEISKGGATPDGVAMGRPHRAIYQCSEDGLGDTIKRVWKPAERTAEISPLLMKKLIAA